MAQTFRLYWLRENGPQGGMTVNINQVHPRIQSRVLDLVNGDAGEFAIRLPFLDKREWRRRDHLLKDLPLKRQGSAIVCTLPLSRAVRDRAAHLVLTHPAWTLAPGDRDSSHFRIWQQVSLALQSWLRRSIAAEYFSDLSRYQDRKAACPMLAYQVARLYHGRSPAEFAFDLRDYPECRDTLEGTWKLTGHSLQMLMESIQRKLHDAGYPVLARRYSPIWSEDVMIAVQRKPRKYIDLLARESMFINAVIDLGTDRSVASINRFGRTAKLALRRIYGMDTRALAFGALEEATNVLLSLSQTLPPTAPIDSQ
jgi:hypothetical protein